MAGNSVRGENLEFPKKSKSLLEVEFTKVQQRTATMDAQTQQMLNRQKELQNSLAQLKRQSEVTARRYKQQLSDLAAQHKQAIMQADVQLETMYAQQMAAIEAEFRKVRNELQRSIQQRLHQLEEVQQQAIQQQNERIAAMENRIEEDNAHSKMVADHSFSEMKIRWQALQQREELAVFVQPHLSAYNIAKQNIDALYQQQQYQAVAGIAVNSSALIQGWQAEAEVAYEEKLELIELCQAQLDYLTFRLGAAAQRDKVSCDGLVTSVELERYALAEFQQLHTCRDAAAEQLVEANAMTLTQMRTFLAKLEGYRADIDRTYRQALLLHRGYLRRERCYRIIAAGMRKLKFGVERATFYHGDFLRGIVLLLRDEYSGNRLSVYITTPDLESGQTDCQVTLYTNSLMDLNGKRALCESFSGQIHNLLSNMSVSGTADVRIGATYRSEHGIWRSDLTVQI